MKPTLPLPNRLREEPQSLPPQAEPQPSTQKYPLWDDVLLAVGITIAATSGLWHLGFNGAVSELRTIYGSDWKGLVGVPVTLLGLPAYAVMIVVSFARRTRTKWVYAAFLGLVALTLYATPRQKLRGNVQAESQPQVPPVTALPKEPVLPPPSAPSESPLPLAAGASGRQEHDERPSEVLATPSAYTAFWSYQGEQIAFWHECLKTPQRYRGRKIKWAIKVSRCGYGQGQGWQSAFIEGYLDEARSEALRRCEVSLVCTTYDPEGFAVIDAMLKTGVAKGQWIAVSGDLEGTEPGSGREYVAVRPSALRNYGYRDDL